MFRARFSAFFRLKILPAESTADFVQKKGTVSLDIDAASACMLFCRREIRMEYAIHALARLAGVSTRTAWHWLNGRRVSTEMDRAIRDALRLPLRAA